MQEHINLTDQEFERQFEAGSLDPSLFTHEAHLRLAWIHVTRYGVEQAIENVCTQLVAYVTLLGATDKYNQTLTTASVKAVNHFVNRSVSETFPAFMREFPRLGTHFKDLLSSHYSVDIVHSEQAKQVYLEPDLLPF